MRRTARRMPAVSPRFRRSEDRGLHGPRRSFVGRVGGAAGIVEGTPWASVPSVTMPIAPLSERGRRVGYNGYWQYPAREARASGPGGVISYAQARPHLLRLGAMLGVGTVSIWMELNAIELKCWLRYENDIQ